MSEDETIKKITQTFSPEQFVESLDSLFINLPDNEKALNIFQWGIAFFENSYFIYSLNLWKRSLQYFQNMQNKDMEAACYGNIGLAYFNLGQVIISIENYKRALEIVDNSILERRMTNLINLGLSYFNLGDFTKAIDVLKTGLNLAREMPNEEGILRSSVTLGAIHYELGNFTKAIDFFKYGLNSNDAEIKAACKTNLSEIYARLSNFEKAIEYGTEALAIAEKIGNKYGQSYCHTNLGNIHLRTNNSQKALEHDQKALALAKDINSDNLIGICYNNLAADYLTINNIIKAIELYTAALETSNRLKNKSTERVALFNLARINYKIEPVVSYTLLKRLIESIESIIARLVQEENKIGYHFFANADEAYKLIITLNHHIRNDDEEAFEYLERSKSRAFLDILAINVDLKPSKSTESLNSLLFEKEKEYLNILRQRQISDAEISIKKFRIKNNFNNVTDDEYGLSEIIDNLNKIYDEIEYHDKEYVSLRRPKAISITEVKNIIS